MYTKLFLYFYSYLITASFQRARFFQKYVHSHRSTPGYPLNREDWMVNKDKHTPLVTQTSHSSNNVETSVVARIFRANIGASDERIERLSIRIEPMFRMDYRRCEKDERVLGTYVRFSGSVVWVRNVCEWTKRGKRELESKHSYKVR